MMTRGTSDMRAAWIPSRISSQVASVMLLMGIMWLVASGLLSSGPVRLLHPVRSLVSSVIWLALATPFLFLAFRLRTSDSPASGNRRTFLASGARILRIAFSSAVDLDSSESHESNDDPVDAAVLAITASIIVPSSLWAVLWPLHSARMAAWLITLGPTLGVFEYCWARAAAFQIQPGVSGGVPDMNSANYLADGRIWVRLGTAMFFVLMAVSMGGFAWAAAAADIARFFPVVSPAPKP